jgi:hypothetical protein
VHETVPSGGKVNKFNSLLLQKMGKKKKGTKQMKERRRRTTDKDMKKTHFSFNFKSSFFLLDNLKGNAPFSPQKVSFL